MYLFYFLRFIILMTQNVTFCHNGVSYSSGLDGVRRGVGVGNSKEVNTVSASDFWVPMRGANTGVDVRVGVGKGEVSSSLTCSSTVGSSLAW